MASISSENKRITVPKLRFPSFKDNWRTIRLGDAVFENLHPVPKPSKDYYRLGIYCHAKGTFHELVPIEKALDVDTMYVVQKDNLIVNITFAWEHAVAVTADDDEGKLVSHRFPTYAFRETEYPEFYKYLILQDRFRYELGVASPGGAGRNRVLNKGAFLEIPISVPSRKEQEKIASFLSKLDERMGRQRKLIDTLIVYEKGISEAIFKRSINVDGNDSIWKKDALGNLGYFYNGLSGKTKEDFGSGESEYIPYMNVYKNKISDECLLERVNISSGEKQNTVRFGDILFTQSSETLEEVGYTSVWLSNKCPYLNSFCFGFRFNDQDSIDPTFIAHYLRSHQIRIAIMREGQGATRVNLSAERLKGLELTLPPIDTQIKIGKFLSALDANIAYQTSIMDKLSEIRAGVLQTLFI